MRKTEAAADKSRAPKTIVIRQADWLQYEGTVGCPKCIHARDHGWGLMGGPHSPECVQRFRRLFEETAEGQERLARNKAKKDAWDEQRRTQERPVEATPQVRFEEHEAGDIPDHARVAADHRDAPLAE